MIPVRPAFLHQTNYLISFTLPASGSMDFTATLGTFTFTAGLEPQCANITIGDDEIPEPEERFLVQLTTSDIPRARILSPDAIVIITDNDSRCPRYYSLHDLCLMLYLGVTVGFEEQLYFVEENITMFDVCLSTNVTTALRIDVNLTVLQGTAFCELPQLYTLFLLLPYCTLYRFTISFNGLLT